MRRFRRVARRLMHRQRSVTKNGIVCLQVERALSRCSASKFPLQQQKLEIAVRCNCL